MALPFLEKMKKKGAAVPTEKKVTGMTVALPSEKEISVALDAKKKFSVLEHALVLRPVMTEKSFRLSIEGKYVFEISPRANKIDVKKAFSNMYGMMPIKVAIIRQDGKTVRSGRRIGKQKEWKKAIVTVKKGQHVNVA